MSCLPDLTPPTGDSTNVHFLSLFCPGPDLPLSVPIERGEIRLFSPNPPPLTVIHTPPLTLPGPYSFPLEVGVPRGLLGLLLQIKNISRQNVGKHILTTARTLFIMEKAALLPNTLTTIPW